MDAKYRWIIVLLYYIRMYEVYKLQLNDLFHLFLWVLYKRLTGEIFEDH